MNILPSEELSVRAKQVGGFSTLIQVLNEGKAQAAVFRLLYDKYLFQPEGLTNGEIETELRTMSQSVVSNALRKLRRKKLVLMRKEQRNVYNYILPVVYETMKNFNAEKLALEK